MKELLNIKDLNFSYGENQVLNELKFTVYENEIVGLLGENGSGKTTLLDCLYGFHGEMKNITLCSTHASWDNAIIKQNVSYIQDTPNLLEYVTAEQYLQFICQIENLSYQDKLVEIQEMIQLLDLTKEYKKKLIKHYSFGMKKKIQLIGELLSHKKLIIIDEPTNGLDVRMIIYLKQLIKAEHRNYGTTFLISSHHTGFLEDICDRVCLFHQHHIVKTINMTKEIALETEFLDVIKRDERNAYEVDH